MTKALLGALLFCLFVSGCDSSSDEDAASAANPQTAANVAAANSAAAPATETIEVTFKVNSTVRGITGTYTGAEGADVAIPATVAASGSEPAYTTMPWETKVKIPITIMRGQQIKLAAKDAFDTDAPITVEIWAEGRQLTTTSGVEPSVYVQKH